MKFKKKPVIIEAIQWNGENIDEIIRFVKARNLNYDRKNGLEIHTLEGNHKANIGDYIIKGIKDEFYPCKPDIFSLTYDKVED